MHCNDLEQLKVTGCDKLTSTQVIVAIVRLTIIENRLEVGSHLTDNYEDTIG